MTHSDEEKALAEEMREKEQQAYDKFVEWLESKEHVGGVSENRYTIDFPIGDILEDWPSNMNDGEIRAVHNSSVSKSSSAVRDLMEGNFFSEAVIHLPPAEESLKQDIVDAMALEDDDDFGIHFGSRALGGISAPDGVITPHIHMTEPAGLTPVQLTTSKAISTFEDVYQCGALALKKKP